MSDVCSCGTCDGCRAAMDEFLCDSLCEVQALCLEIGTLGSFVLRNEDDISRDDYNSIKAYQEAATKTYDIGVCNIVYSPNQHQLERAGLYEQSEVMIKTPTKCWLDQGISFKDIDIKRMSVSFGDEVFKLKEKGRDQVVVGTTPLYYSFGLTKN
jgi:hypothetical protein